ncbi:MAG: cytochrome c-type biogenesis protein CcmH [Candidatus Acidiferrales bacterium]
MTNLSRNLACQRTRKSPCPPRRFSASSALSFCLRSVTLALTLAISSGPVAVAAQQLPRAKDLSKRVMCMCGGCEDSAGLCSHPGGTFSGPCDTARGMQKDLDARVARNESDDAILQAYVEQYGPTVLVEPPKKGFDLLAWVMPVLLPLIALILVWQVVRRWKQKAALAPAGGPPIDAAFLERVQREAGREPTKDHDE